MIIGPPAKFHGLRDILDGRLELGAAGESILEGVRWGEQLPGPPPVGVDAGGGGESAEDECVGIECGEGAALDAGQQLSSRGPVVEGLPARDHPGPGWMTVRVDLPDRDGLLAGVTLAE